MFTPYFEIIQTHFILIIGFFVVALLYSSVGFGGGSSYLALLSLTSISFVEYRAIALICNILVVSVGTFLYAKKEFLDWKKVIPIVVLSIPMAFIGGYINVDKTFFLILLGSTLIVAAILMLSKKSNSKSKKNTTIKSVIIGGFIGFISGLVGIGGGIFLSPFLHLSNWDTVKKIAATSSFFILVNSVSGLIGQIQNPIFKLNIPLVFILAGAVFVGAQIGSRISLKYINPRVLKIMTAFLIASVGTRLLVYNIML